MKKLLEKLEHPKILTLIIFLFPQSEVYVRSDIRIKQRRHGVWTVEGRSCELWCELRCELCGWTACGGVKLWTVEGRSLKCLVNVIKCLVNVEMFGK